MHLTERPAARPQLTAERVVDSSELISFGFKIDVANNVGEVRQSYIKLCVGEWHKHVQIYVL